MLLPEPQPAYSLCMRMRDHTKFCPNNSARQYGVSCLLKLTRGPKLLYLGGMTDNVVCVHDLGPDI